MTSHEIDLRHMGRALELAARGRGSVEPNPMVGCVICEGSRILSEGWHARFGGPHAEVVALEKIDFQTDGATLYVTLEPCSHHGKTPPCAEAIVASGIRRVVISHPDPFPQVDGRGLTLLKDAGLQVEVGLLKTESEKLNAPYLKLLRRGMPWVIAKWAMTLDGKIATRDHHSQWISGDSSREVVHQIRGRVDGILIGLRTAQIDDPLLTARPSGPRTATRIVLDSQAKLSLHSRLVSSAQQAPVLVATGPDAQDDDIQRLAAAGCQMIVCTPADPVERVTTLLKELGDRQFTNVLVEGGAQVFGSFFDAKAVDEVHAFVAPKIVGGQDSLTPLAGRGVSQMTEALQLRRATINCTGDDIHVHGYLTI